MLTLEEVYNGCTKKMKISRRVLNDDGHTTSTREKILTINVKKGWREGTRITFSKEGDQGPNKIPGKYYRPMPIWPMLQNASKTLHMTYKSFHIMAALMHCLSINIVCTKMHK